MSLATAKVFVRLAGIEREVAIVAGVGASSFCAVYALGPAGWLADPAIAGRFGRDHPTAARLVCGVGVILGAGVAAFA